MKKIMILFAVTAVCIGVILLVGFTAGLETIEVDVLSLEPKTAELTISCEGIVQAEKRYDVYAEYPLVAERITVRIGDRVNEGELLLITDAASTRRQLNAAGKFSDEVVEAAAKQVIKAPSSGVVTAINVTEGGATDTAKPCFTIEGTNTLQILATIDEADIRAVKLGQKARVSGRGFSKESYSGTVTHISSMAHSVGGKTMVEAVITLLPIEQDSSLKLGLNADVEVITEHKPDCLILPFEALEEADGEEYVYVVKEGKAVKQVVTTGEVLPEGILVVDGLTKDDRVIANSQNVSQEGVSVRMKGDS